MVTTAVFAEIVVGGLEAEAWMSLFVLAIFGSSWIHLGAVHDWVALITLLVLAAAYVLGVMIDRVADTFLVRLLGRLLPPRPVDRPAPIEVMRMTLLTKDDAAARFLDYQRSRMRVARATVFNLVALLPALVLFLSVQTDASALDVVTVAFVNCAIALIAIFVYRGIEFAYLCRMSEAYRLAEGLPEADIAAAVCYRWRGADPGFAIVRTKDHRFWTFPKGHRKGAETLPETARREAREEAGIRGTIRGKRLSTYRYPPTRAGRRDDDWVAAFLLAVGQIEQPHEDRELRWCDFIAAHDMLALDRDPDYAAGMQEALIAAADELDLSGDAPQ